MVRSHNEQLVALQKQIDDLKVGVNYNIDDLKVRESDHLDLTSGNESQLNGSRTSSSSIYNNDGLQDRDSYERDDHDRSMSPQSEAETLHKAISLQSMGITMGSSHGSGNSSNSSMDSRSGPHVGYYPVPERSISPTSATSQSSKEERRRLKK